MVKLYLTYGILLTGKVWRLRDGYVLGADAVMGICDVTSKNYWNESDGINEMNNQELPSVACGNKSDINGNPKEYQKQIKRVLKENGECIRY